MFYDCEPQFATRDGRRSAIVKVTLQGNRTIEKRVFDPKGDGDNPMSDADLERKFTTNCEPVIGAARCAALLESVGIFETLADVREIMR